MRFVIAFLLAVWISPAAALPVLEFGAPVTVTAPQGSPFVLPVTIRNTGDQAFTFVPPDGSAGSGGPLAPFTFREGSRSSGGLINESSFGPINAPPVMGAVTFYDQDFHDEFAGKTLLPGQSMIFSAATARIGMPPSQFTSFLLGEVGVGYFGFEWHDGLAWHQSGVGIITAIGEPDFGPVAFDGLQAAINLLAVTFQSPTPVNEPEIELFSFRFAAFFEPVDVPEPAGLFLMMIAGLAALRSVKEWAGN